MITPVSPESVLVIHKDKERELLRKIELIREAKERGTYQSVDTFGQWRTRYAQAAQWMKTNLFQRAGRQPEMFEEPCPESVPC